MGPGANQDGLARRGRGQGVADRLERMRAIAGRGVAAGSAVDAQTGGQIVARPQVWVLNSQVPAGPSWQMVCGSVDPPYWRRLSMYAVGPVGPAPIMAVPARGSLLVATWVTSWPSTKGLAVPVPDSEPSKLYRKWCQPTASAGNATFWPEKVRRPTSPGSRCR